ncbi:hypothetical protein JDV02_010528 [Purpureocillium takamizusanense]|uniref:SnoaL-like domain-containing protein n=1 Tax=Purpureocillium takamizusanense TaxID=2060973 RepID=A0A9Q8QQU0_9HYPO|nr:uncharacterized protein JDV02_010528 [Purpureocillium takamizusanense]UNI24808.1 hypothetical protein JDV02_010528 [Purpureocillium takamizusanense]
MRIAATSRLLYTVLCLVLPLPILALANPTSRCRKTNKMPSRQELTQTRDDYLTLWGGDLSLADRVLFQDVKLNIDRPPSANGSAPVVANDPGAFVNFVKFAHAGWETSEFKVIHWVAEGHNIAIRWKAEAIMGKD